MISSGDLRPGNTFMIGKDIFVCLDASHNKTARAAANNKIKMKNLRNGAITTQTFGSGEKFAPAIIDKKDMQYLYNDGTNIIFMDQESYEQIEIDAKLLE
jgi:elongation factor P